MALWNRLNGEHSPDYYVEEKVLNYSWVNHSHTLLIFPHVRAVEGHIHPTRFWYVERGPCCSQNDQVMVCQLAQKNNKCTGAFCAVFNVHFVQFLMCILYSCFNGNTKKNSTTKRSYPTDVWMFQCGQVGPRHTYMIAYRQAEFVLWLW